jgi:hypothetical protein
MRMLHFAEPSKNIGSIRPVAKQILDRCYDVAKFWKIAVMQTQATNQFPDPLDRVQVRTVWREEQKPELRLLGAPPFFVHGGVVVSGVVNNDSHTRRPALMLAACNRRRNAQVVTASNFPTSLEKQNLPSRRRTAPK